MKPYLASITAAAVLSGCAAGGPGFGQDNRPFTNTESGILIGAASGAVIGAVAYKQNRSRGAVIGAIGGGIAGGAVGAYMDSQKQDLEKSLAQEIRSGQARIDKMPNDVVRITMTNQTAFETDSSPIKPGFDSTMDKVADVVVRYRKTTLTVVGHTDNVGSERLQPEALRAARARRGRVPRVQARQRHAPRARRQGRDPADREQRLGDRAGRRTAASRSTSNR